MSDGNRTVWVSRDLKGSGSESSIELFSEPPIFRMKQWWGDSSLLDLDQWFAVGLHEEPKAGECWRVEWQRLRFRIDASTGSEVQAIDGMLVPIATNVTEELRGKEKAGVDREKTDGA